MFLPWTIFAANLILTALQLLLVGAVGATLALYSRFGGEYANSIRWIHQGGYLEMVTSLINSRNVGKSTKMAMLLAILATIVSNFMDNGVSYFIKPAEREGSMSSAMIATGQYMPFDGRYTLDGWSVYVRNGTNITNSVLSTMNDTRVVLDASGKLYKPQMFSYERDECGEYLMTPSQEGVLLLSSKNCGNTTISIDEFTQGSTSITKKSEGRWNVTMHGNFTENTGSKHMVSKMTVNVGPRTCSIANVKRTDSPSGSGMLSLPMTSVTKCNEENVTIAISISSMSLTTGGRKFRELTTGLFNEYDDLFQSMEATIRDESNLVARTMMMEVKVVDGSTNILFCYVNMVHEGGELACSYVIYDVIITKPREINPILRDPVEREDYLSMSASTMLTVHYSQCVVNGTISYVPITDIRMMAHNVTQLFASLGYNFRVDWLNNQLYVLYDIVDIQKGLDVPTWIAVCVVSIMVICACVWGLTMLLLDDKYRSSLYTIISMQIAPRIGNDAPMLMKSKLTPMEFEHVPIMSVDESHEMDKIDTPLMS